jgi:hypothetical protein
LNREDGSIMPLAIGLSALAVALTLAMCEVATLQVTHSRAQSEARFAAMLVIKSQNGIPPVAELDYGPTLSGLIQASSIRVVSHDSKTVEATVCETWQSPFGLHADQLVCAVSRSRTVPV